jgi:hypothetical protein
MFGEMAHEIARHNAHEHRADDGQYVKDGGPRSNSPQDDAPLELRTQADGCLTGVD